MSFTVFLGNLPAWVTAEDIESWLVAENLAADSVKVIRDHETQKSREFAFNNQRGHSKPMPKRRSLAPWMLHAALAGLEDRKQRAAGAKGKGKK